LSEKHSTSFPLVLLRYLQAALIAVAVCALRLWKLLLSPMFGENCRFHPTCSEYAIDALKEHGLLKGAYLSLRRIGRCNSRSAGGLDPVPKRQKA
jgi:hypothetical protein